MLLIPGYVMGVQASYPSWSNLASPEFSPFPGMSCLAFYWHSSSRDRAHILLVHARINGQSTLVVRLHPDDYAFEKDATNFCPVFVTIPAYADRLFFQMKVGTVDLHSVEMLRENLTFAIDDVLLTPGSCRQGKN